MLHPYRFLCQSDPSETWNSILLISITSNRQALIMQQAPICQWSFCKQVPLATACLRRSRCSLRQPASCVAAVGMQDLCWCTRVKALVGSLSGRPVVLFHHWNGQPGYMLNAAVCALLLTGPLKLYTEATPRSAWLAQPGQVMVLLGCSLLQLASNSRLICCISSRNSGITLSLLSFHLTCWWAVPTMLALRRICANSPYLLVSSFSFSIALTYAVVHFHATNMK